MYGGILPELNFSVPSNFFPITPLFVPPSAMMPGGAPNITGLSVLGQMNWSFTPTVNTTTNTQYSPPNLHVGQLASHLAFRSNMPAWGGIGMAAGLDALGGLGKGMSQTGGTFRMTNGAYNGSQVSLKHYNSNWQGGSKARITTYSMNSWGRGIIRGSGFASATLGAFDIYQGYIADGNTFGINAKQATGRTVGGMAGGSAGAWVGGIIGGFFFGYGAIPGAIIGGTVGGWLGSEGGEELLKLYD